MGLTEIVVEKIISSLGISKETIDKIEAIADNIDVKTEDGKTIIEFKIKNITIVIDNN
jgi:hypothetical protein